MKGDPHKVTYGEILNTYGTSSPKNNAQINSIIVPKVSTKTFVCSGDAYIGGNLQTILKTTQPVVFVQGSQQDPSMTFVNTSNGFYYNDTVEYIGVTINNNTVLTLGDPIRVGAPISTISGDLILNPTGNNIDFSGKNLINYGSITSNPNRFDVIGVNVITTSAVPTNILNIALNLAAYTVQLDVVATSGVNSTIFSFIIFARNPTGMPNYTVIKKYEELIPSMLNVNVSFAVSSNMLHVVGIGNSDTINWLAGSTLTRQLY